MLDIFESWRSKRRNHQAGRHLSQLSDHILTDLGLSRADVVSMAVNGRAPDRRR